jgi:hypothetical protein
VACQTRSPSWKAARLSNCWFARTYMSRMRFVKLSFDQLTTYWGAYSQLLEESHGR